jgi:hypothetical protein
LVHGGGIGGSYALGGLLERFGDQNVGVYDRVKRIIHIADDVIVVLGCFG